ncbi:MAG: hypothetical protein AABN34_22910 [Acidobacteriota bacterium]
MTEETRLKSGLAVVFVLFLLINTALVTLAAKAAFQGVPFALISEDTSMGIRWLFLTIVLLAVVGLDLLVHRMFLESGIAPVDTTWTDFIFMAYLVLTAAAVLFLVESLWLILMVSLVVLFLLTAIILKRLLPEVRPWLIWVIGSIVLMGVTVVLITTVFGK